MTLIVLAIVISMYSLLPLNWVGPTFRPDRRSLNSLPVMLLLLLQGSWVDVFSSEEAVISYIGESTVAFFFVVS